MTEFCLVHSLKVTSTNRQFTYTVVSLWNLYPKITAYKITWSWCLINSTEAYGPWFLVAKIEVAIIEKKENQNEEEVFFLPGFPHSTLVFSCFLFLLKDKERHLCTLLFILVFIFLSSFSHIYQDLLLICSPLCRSYILCSLSAMSATCVTVFKFYYVSQRKLCTSLLVIPFTSWNKMCVYIYMYCSAVLKIFIYYLWLNLFITFG